jgi:hypothetical protein
MSLIPAVLSVASIFLGLSAAIAQQATNNAAASASSALTNPPVFQGLMADAKGKTVGRLYLGVGFLSSTVTATNVVRQISGTWVMLPVGDFTVGFSTVQPPYITYMYQSLDCTGQAYLNVNGFSPTFVTEPAVGLVMTFPPATAPSIYFAGSPAKMVTIQSYLSTGYPCQLWSTQTNPPNPNYVGPIQVVPVRSLGLTLPFSVK